MSHYGSANQTCRIVLKPDKSLGHCCLASAKREVDSVGDRSADLQGDCSFIWDETSQLYFDARLLP